MPTGMFERSGEDLLEQVEGLISRTPLTPRARSLVDAIVIAWSNAGLLDETRRVCLELASINVPRYVQLHGRDYTEEEAALTRKNLGLPEVNS